jgi:hypothetical protein
MQETSPRPGTKGSFGTVAGAALAPITAIARVPKNRDLTAKTLQKRALPVAFARVARRSSAIPRGYKRLVPPKTTQATRAVMSYGDTLKVSPQVRTSDLDALEFTSDS